MKNFVDRQPTLLGRRKITHEDGTTEYITMEMADEPEETGTPLNREAFMALQGFEGTTTLISKADGITTITSKNSNQEVATTKISKTNGVTTISVSFVGSNGTTISSKTNISKSDGIITITKEVNG